MDMQSEHQKQLECECRDMLDRISAAQTVGHSVRNFGPESLELGEKVYRAGRSDLAAALLSPLADCGVRLARFYFLLALAQYDEQNASAAYEAIAKAAEIAPDDPDIAVAHAQFAFDNWRPAAKLFRNAQRLAPTNLEISKSAAAALYAENNVKTAIKVLGRVVGANPDWVIGQQELAKYNILSGEQDKFDAGFKSAIDAQPKNSALWLAWFNALAQAKEWDRARTVIGKAESAMGVSREFDIANAFIASESGDDDEARRQFEQLADIIDPMLDLSKVRFYLRTHDTDRAIEVAKRHIHGDAARSFWPYLSVAWRVAGDARTDWLDRGGSLIKEFDLPFDAGFLADLAATLRDLHSTKPAYLEQSVRRGTQTDRNLFFHGSPVIQHVRNTIMTAIRQYIDALPDRELDHPFLGVERDRIRVDGSWSILLRPEGFHVSHVHPAGWISSALYVSLPKADAIGEAPAGWISFGEAPPELEFILKPYAQVKPIPGRLVLFPSTMWHRTIPFVDGERLTIAFDVSSVGTD